MQNLVVVVVFFIWAVHLIDTRTVYMKFFCGIINKRLVCFVLSICTLWSDAYSSLEGLDEEMWLYPSKAMRGSVASHTGARDGFVVHTGLPMASAKFIYSSTTNCYIFIYIQLHASFWRKSQWKIFKLVLKAFGCCYWIPCFFW